MKKKQEILKQRRVNKFVCLLSIAISFFTITWNGCVEAPPYYYAEKITGKTFEPLNQSIGIYPDTSVMNDPHNPFAQVGVGRETKWDIESSGDPVAGFYAWATVLVSEATGEHQFYTALNLKAIYKRGLTETEDQVEEVKTLAIRAFQAVLDYFPESVTYDSSGKIPYGLATLAYQELVDLGGIPLGGWQLVTSPDGSVVAIRNLDVPTDLYEEEEEAE